MLFLLVNVIKAVFQQTITTIISTKCKRHWQWGVVKYCTMCFVSLQTLDIGISGTDH